MMDTKIWQANGHTQSLKEAAELLRNGGLVAFPTETVYGLGANAADNDAVQGIFRAKGRPSDNPLIVHIADMEQLDGLVEPYPPLARRLMEKYWPGPLTLVLPVKTGALSPLVTAGLPTVGVRMPDHALALQLLRQAGCPVAAPSANLSGRPSPTTADHVADDLTGRIDGIVDGGATGVGLESTVVELVDEGTVRILRPGGVTMESLAEELSNIRIIREGLLEADQAPRSPGMKYTHYAPKGELCLVRGRPSDVTAYINDKLMQAKAAGVKTGVLAFRERAHRYDTADRVEDCGSERNLEEAAHRLYGALRRFDDEGIERMWAEGCVPDGGIGEALLNRLAKAAGHLIVNT
ncbi:L-threonylcarbamoyladenylate synthase [Paenibacillus sp. J5C_2022]|uniref:L-threonylcarbamoyladenylate synthase n=1 Tax=Paenibacillus sp. J5C2022 TaxID=2977129 RepID=UPI0021D3D7C8|nr:L-threonylcarbamoyladenylate synthase [Paenibacillus sp. J5C2022]MCU6708524.1 L-threonylcarbamoyladenylate synthase [Paenibacillus sp. J5C2022]